MSTTVTLPRGGLKRRGVVVTGRLLGRRPRRWWLGLVGAACLGATAPAQAAPITVVCATCAQPPAPPFVYVTNFGDGTVSEYDVAADGTLTPKLGPGCKPVSTSTCTPLTVGAGRFPFGIAVTPDGKSVYVTNTSDNTVSQYSVGAGGALSAKTPATVATGGAPVGIAVGPAQLRFPCASVIIVCSAGIQQVGSSMRITGTIVRANTSQGILVERILGRRRVRVGRVPFGPHPAGRLRIRWALRVNGHKLPVGRYLITLRMFDRRQNLIAAAHPVQITVH